MARLIYNTATPMGQMVAEGINDLQNGFAKITRTSESVTLMDTAQMVAELGVPEDRQDAFRSGLNQIRTALEGEPFSTLLPNYDQG